MQRWKAETYLNSIRHVLTRSSKDTIVGWTPGKGLWPEGASWQAGNVTVNDDWSGTMTQLKSL